MKVTVCELTNDALSFVEAWQGLVQHVHEHGSDLVLLPEMPFHSWLAHTPNADHRMWLASVQAHDQWLGRLADLAPAMVAGTRPILRKNRRLNEGFLWTNQQGYKGVHTKYYLPDEPGFWEASWYERGDGLFQIVDSPVGRIGFLICTEMWFYQHARRYGNEGIQLLLVPRATPTGTGDKWLAGGRVAAVVSGAYCLSANLSGKTKHGGNYAGLGWIVEPEAGDVLGLTSAESPFLTLEIDLAKADQAKKTYPRYVLD